MTGRDHHTGRILAHVEAGKAESQRSLSRELGIALGLTNLLVRRTIRKEWVRLVRTKPNRLAYFITPAGIAEKARLSRAYFTRTLQFYGETRDRIRERFDAVAVEWPAGNHADNSSGEKRVVFYGAGEVAEIGYICLQDSDMKLVAAVDEERTRPFFGLPVHHPDRLNGMTINGEPFEVDLHAHAKNEVRVDLAHHPI